MFILKIWWQLQYESAPVNIRLRRKSMSYNGHAIVQMKKSKVKEMK